MLNHIWVGIMSLGFLVGWYTGNMDKVTKAFLDSASGAVTLGLGLMGILCLWSKIIRIADKSGIIDNISAIAEPFIKFLFPGVPSGHKALAAIVMNIAANFLGLGNAATPLGIKAMEELQSINPVKQVASNEMCMFLVLNASAVQLIPATVIALRASYGSLNPAEITITVWIASICASIFGIIAAKIMSKVYAGNKKIFCGD